MAYDKSLVIGIMLLVMIPVIMSYLGATFNTDTSLEPQTDNANALSEVSTPPGFGFLKNTFDGYALFPWWFNVAIILIPLALTIRSIISF